MSAGDIRDYDFLRELFDKAPLPYQSLDADGCLLRVNRAWLELLGYTEDEVLGHSITEFLTPSSLQILDERFSRFKHTGHVSEAEFELIRKDGSVVPIELNGTIASDADGDFLRTHCIFMDVSDRRASRQRLQESEQRYRSLVELAHEGIWQLDKDANTLYVNPAMAAMLGYGQDEMVGRSFFDFLVEGDRATTAEYLAQRHEGIAQEHDVHLVARDGRRVEVAIGTRPLHDREGRYLGAIAGVIDISGRRQLDRRLLHAQKLESLELMAGGIAHDFNNLLQTILGNADLALMTGPHESDLRVALESIVKASRQAAGLCRQMLAYAGHGEYAMEELRLDEVVRDLETLLRATITRKADLRLELAPEVPPVVADPSQLRQVAVNLVTNAAEALHDRPGTITVTVGLRSIDADDIPQLGTAEELKPGDYVVLAVQDTGCGIAHEAIPSIFDPFYSTKFTGRGLGLAVVRGVARAHGGAVVVESRESRGSCFELWLPVAPAPAAAAGISASDAAGPRANGRTVLVADDDDELRELVLRMIQRLGWHAVGVADGAAAVDALASEPARYALVLLDWSMPVMDGREALEAIRHAAPDLPVFMSSGHAADALAAQVEHLRPTGFLAKPYRLAELRRVLSAWDGPST